VLNSFQHNRRR